MRIVGGRFRGTALAAPKSMAIRPTTDRVRETLFNILAHGHDDPVAAARVLDLFSGTGALGLEALSRGARFCLFVEDAAEARGLIRANVEKLGLTGATKLWRRDATKLGELSGGLEPFDLCFLDPPYGKGLGERALAAARDGGWLRPGALCVLEEATEAPFALPAGFELLDDRDYGEARLRFLQVAE
ncbi:16S rRNA (guanine(966)-N(2))-methyltransferase RsmD [Prosthecomicrobium hirschii]|uniref:16S rRNA (Guanine(966)-N(2))-methyltransferase RsmD n=1 Tax=Prosthecodimorpha hirschii TaxID=665126 RepID=A0A0P6W6Q0_9HYPH|nr:16S rRNA (guanine(966)-N(2))-methyltransferase RsmD [Prosthecomicrobium hirschii]KPL54221.1 16S rRNA (guanine(966)-N(2))-methyltransferase RsmD [Prosthecomicrobium hirschii]